MDPLSLLEQGEKLKELSRPVLCYPSKRNRRKGIHLDRLHSCIRTIYIQSLHCEAEIFSLVSKPHISSLRIRHCPDKCLFCLWFKWGHDFTGWHHTYISKNISFEPNLAPTPRSLFACVRTATRNLHTDSFWIVSDWTQGCILLPKNSISFTGGVNVVHTHNTIHETYAYNKAQSRVCWKFGAQRFHNWVKDISARTYLSNPVACFLLCGKVAGKGVTLFSIALGTLMSIALVYFKRSYWKGNKVSHKTLWRKKKQQPGCTGKNAVN